MTREADETRTPPTTTVPDGPARARVPAGSTRERPHHEAPTAETGEAGKTGGTGGTGDSGGADRPDATGGSGGGGSEGGGGGEGHEGETRTTVWVALGANLLIAAAKLAGGLIAASPALLSEAAHSVADSLNEVFLLASLTRSQRPADATHPFGYGKERFFWSLLAAVGIFVTGGCFSFFQGVQAFSEGSETLTGYLVGLGVLLVSLAAEGTSLTRALLQSRAEGRKAGRGLREQIRASDDPTLRTVLAEDSAACLGVVLAVAGMALHMATGQVAYEAVASLLIGLLLVYVAYVLGRSAKEQLIGEAADAGLQREIWRFLDGQPEIDTVTTCLTMQLSPDSVMLAVRTDLRPGIDSERVEDVMVRVKGALAERWPQLDQIFLDVTDASEQDRLRAARHRRTLERSLREAAGS